MKYVIKPTGDLYKIFKEYERLLGDFCIAFDPIIQHKIIELYPNEIAMENYIHTVIKKRLDDQDGRS